MPVVQGIAMWACVHKPNTRYTPVYCINLHFDEKVAKILNQDGLGKKIKKSKKEELKHGKFNIQFRSKVTYPDGSPIPPPNVVDKGNRPFSENIGNGSKVNVQYSPVSGTNKFGDYTIAQLVGVQVLDLVPYIDPNHNEFETLESTEESEFSVDTEEDEDDEESPY